MPSHNVKQAKVMSAISHGWHPSDLDIPVKVARDFHAADAGHKYGKGHDKKATALRIARSKRKKFAEGGAAGDDYNTALSPDQERAFQAWKAQKMPGDSGVDYDQRGAYLAGLQQQSNGHWEDQFKKPNHPTFSDQSQYAPSGSPGTWAGNTFIPPAPMADGGDTLPDVGDPAIGDGGQFSEGTKLGNKAADIGSKLGYGMMTGAVTSPYHIAKNMVEGSQESMQDGVGELSPKSIQGSGDLVMQGVGQTAGVRPSGTTAGVFVGPYGAHMLRDADRSAAMPHPVVGEEIKQRASTLRPEFQDIYKGAAQDMRDAQARGTLEMREGSGNPADRDVWANSGWSRGSEGMIKKEIPDTGAKLVPLKGTDKFVLEHPAGDLHKIYDVPPIQFNPSMKPMNGTFNPDTNQIIIGGRPTQANLKAATSVALHEFQHVAQKKEGFAGGANTYMAQRRPEIEQELFPTGQTPEQLTRWGPSDQSASVPSWHQEMANKQKSRGEDPTSEKSALNRGIYETYRRSAGETEARNVQDRRAKSYRYQSHPADTEDIGRGLQWVDDRYIPRTYEKAGGGSVGGNFNPERGAAFGLAKEGMINSSVPGRTDKLNLNVPTGSYVIPADIPSAIGQGNSAAGSSILNKMFSKGPYGMNLSKSKGPRVGVRHSSLHPLHFAKGGAVNPTTPIVAAGGEYLIHPDTIRDLGNGDIQLGHSILDAFVKHVREKHIKTLEKLPGPKGSK